MNEAYLRQLKRFYRIQRDLIKSKILEFKSLPEEKYLEEFIFCILTPQSKAEKCWEAVEAMGPNKAKLTQEEIANILKKRARFHNNKAKYVFYAIKKWSFFEEKIKRENSSTDLRNWLAENVKGYGLKEASHFLRNIGKSNNSIAILDRHILKNLKEAGIISSSTIKSKKHYLDIESKYINLAEKVKIPPDELDLLFWSKESGKIFK